MNWVWVCIGGGLGAAIRWSLSSFFTSDSSFPYGTLSVNLLGCLLIGMASVWVLHHPKWSLFLITGFLGGFTTFSSFGLEVFKLLQLEEYRKCVTYVLLSNILGVALVILAHKLTSYLIQ